MSPVVVSVQRIKFGSPEYQLCLDLRNRVLREPLGLELSSADTEGEATQVHFLATLKGRAIATCCLRPCEDGRFHLRQMAVDPEVRGRGYGTAVLREIERYAANASGACIILEARTEVMAFYGKSGYQASGEPYRKLDISHIRMEKKLGSTGTPSQT